MLLELQSRLTFQVEIRIMSLEEFGLICFASVVIFVWLLIKGYEDDV